MRKTYYYCYDMPEKKDWLRQSMNELSKYLAMPPTWINYTFFELSEEYVPDIHKILETPRESFHSLQDRIVEYFAKKPEMIAYLLVICSQDSILTEMALRADPVAKWGATLRPIALAYHTCDKYTTWHETFHLLGAEDCYDRDKDNDGPNCDLSNCIMQYVPTSQFVGGWPFLCQKNIQKVQKGIQQWGNSCQKEK
jgi:hypothetical protein